MTIRTCRGVGALAVAVALALWLTTTSATAAGDYDQPLRPQFHFSLPTGWIGDPNGLVYRDGRYYLYSYGTWEGATSTDLVHWSTLPVTGPARDPGTNAFFSGSAVYDQDDTSGLGTKANPPMVAMFTSVQAGTDIETQSLAYSTDGGSSWTRYDGNPVLDLHSVNFRDPKVFWYAPGKTWLMVISLSDQHKVSIYRSPNLKDWSHLSDFGPAGSTSGVWEMPDLYPLNVDGDPHHTKWVLSVSVGSTGVQYFVGDFDGTTFTSDDSASYTPPPGTTVQDFESGYGAWVPTGTAFGSTPAHGTLPDQQTVGGYQGSSLANSYLGGDSSTGELTSPAFVIDKPRLNFLVGGGNHPYVTGTVPYGQLPAGSLFTDFSTGPFAWTGTGDFAGIQPSTDGLPNQISSHVLDTWGPKGDPSQGTITSPTFTISSPYIDLQVAGGNHPWGQANPTAVNLIVGGQVVATATGPNAPDLTFNNWDVSKYQGQQAQIQVVDQNDGSNGWGHMMIGDIVFANAPARPWDDQTSVNLLVDGQVVRSATGSNSEALDWTSWDLSDLEGKQARIQIVDHSTGGWGHVLADDFMLSDQPALSMNQRAHWVDHGADFYAANTWNGTPDGRRVMVAWENNWDYAGAIPTAPWQGAETFPRDLGLKTIDGRIQLVARPVTALAQLRRGPAGRATHVTAADSVVPLPVAGRTLDLTAHLTAGTASRFGLRVRSGTGADGAPQYTEIGYDRHEQQLYVDRTRSGLTDFSSSFPRIDRAALPLVNGGITLHVLIDRSSVEVYADQGQVTLTDQVFPDPTSTGVDLFADEGTATLDSVQAWKLSSVWR